MHIEPLEPIREFIPAYSGWQTPSTPEQRLWTYVLLKGIESAFRGDLDDVVWLFYDNRIYTGSFRNTCYDLNIDPDRLRAMLRARWHTINLFARSVGRIAVER